MTKRPCDETTGNPTLKLKNLFLVAFCPLQSHSLKKHTPLGPNLHTIVAFLCVVTGKNGVIQRKVQRSFLLGNGYLEDGVCFTYMYTYSIVCAASGMLCDPNNVVYSFQNECYQAETLPYTVKAVQILLLPRLPEEYQSGTHVLHCSLLVEELVVHFL